VKRRAFCLPWCFVMAPLRRRAHPRIAQATLCISGACQQNKDQSEITSISARIAVFLLIRLKTGIYFLRRYAC